MATGRYVHRFDVDDQHSVHIYQGSLTEVQADALVSSDDNHLSAGGGVSAALALMAGEDVTRERFRLIRESRLRLGNVVRTSGGGLPCRYLYHAITVDFSADSAASTNRGWMDEAVLRELVVNLLKQATQDGVGTLGMPALGTGVAGFDLGRASEIIIEELLGRLVDTPLRHIVLALVGDDAQRLFYEQLVRANAPRCAVSSLRHFEEQLTTKPSDKHARVRAPRCHIVTEASKTDGQALASVGFAVKPAQEPGPEAGRPEFAGETGEQFPSLVDKTRLAAMAAGQPKLVAGLAALVCKHAEPADIEQELLSRPECYGFRGTVEQRLMEFLYLGEKNLRMALGPALFRARDLRHMADELGEDCELARDPEQLIDLILRALCFNLLAPPIGLTHYVARVERLILDLEAPDALEANRVAAGLEAAKLLEQVLKDILRLYGFYLFGAGFEQELVRSGVVPARRDGGVARLTLGQAREGLVHLEAMVKKDRNRVGTLSHLGRDNLTLLPARITIEHTGNAVDSGQLLGDFIRWRNQDLVHDAGAERPPPDQRAVREQLACLRGFLLACRAEGIYPEVLRYEGTFENRNGERFVHFLDERNGERKVRTDEKIDPRRHYYCFATNNPLHLFPVLVPKL